MSAKDKSNWARVEAMTDGEIERNAFDDQDSPPTDEAFWADAILKEPEPKKIPVCIRINPDILDYFKRSGPGYQTRINQVLESYVAHQKGKPLTR